MFIDDQIFTLYHSLSSSIEHAHMRQQFASQIEVDTVSSMSRIYESMFNETEKINNILAPMLYDYILVDAAFPQTKYLICELLTTFFVLNYVNYFLSIDLHRK